MSYYGGPPEKSYVTPPPPVLRRGFFPTPPWATRAFMAWLRHDRNLITRADLLGDPCCGQGHMAFVLQEFSARPVACSDIYDYGYGQVGDFLDDGEKPAVDWWILNPPFDQALEFCEVALEHPAAKARIGVAALVRLGFLETQRRERLFKRRPPLIAAVCIDRPNLTLGYWDPEGTTRMPYCWVVWLQDRGTLPPSMVPRFERRPELDWIRSGARTLYAKPDDALLWGGRKPESWGDGATETDGSAEAIGAD